MLIIQCGEKLFNKIADKMEPLKPVIVEDKGGYIDTFDKGWVFIFFNKVNDKILTYIKKSNYPYLYAITDSNILVKKEIAEGEQYIFIRKVCDEYKVTNGCSSWIEFKEE